MKLPFNLDSVIENVSKVKLRGGMAGKICHVLIFVAISIAIVACSFRTLLVAILALCMIFVLTFIMLWRLINLAYKNPQTALMDGAELLIHEQMVIGSKNNPEKMIKQSDLTESKPLTLSSEEKKLLNKPDPVEIKEIIEEEENG